MDIIPIIPIGSKVTIKNSDIVGIVDSVSIEANNKSYHIVSYDNVYGRRSYWVREHEIGGKYKKTTLLQSLLKVSNDDTSNDVKHMSRLALVTNTVKSILEFGFYIPIDGEVKDIAIDKLPRVEIVDVQTYTDTGDNLLVSGDKYFKVYTGVSDEAPIVIINRRYKLKSFLRSWFTTMRYGRDHKDNFSYIEPTEEYFERVVLELIKSCPNGFMCNKNTVAL